MTDRQAGRQTGRQTGGQTDRQAGNGTGRQADRQADRQAGKQEDRQTDRQTDRQSNRQTDRHVGKKDTATRTGKLYIIPVDTTNTTPAQSFVSVSATACLARQVNEGTKSGCRHVGS